MADLLTELLKNSMEREAKKMASSGGVTEKDRYGTFLDSVKGRNLEQEENDRRQEMLSRMHRNTEESRIQREKESAEAKRNLQMRVTDIENRERREANEFISKNKAYLDKAQETIRKEQSKTYFD